MSAFAELQSLVLDQERGMFPHCADTLIIPMMGLKFLYTILTCVALIVGLVLTLWFQKLPVKLLNWDPEHRMKSWSLTMVFGALGLLIAFLTIDGSVHSGFIGTPAGIVALYLVEATRSALLAPPQSENRFLET